MSSGHFYFLKHFSLFLASFLGNVSVIIRDVALFQDSGILEFWNYRSYRNSVCVFPSVSRFCDSLNQRCTHWVRVSSCIKMSKTANIWRYLDMWYFKILEFYWELQNLGTGPLLNHTDLSLLHKGWLFLSNGHFYFLTHFLLFLAILLGNFMYFSSDFSISIRRFLFYTDDDYFCQADFSIF